MEKKKPPQAKKSRRGGARPKSKDEAPRAESKSSASRRPERKTPDAPRQKPVRDDEPDDGWNGPMPGFLSVGFGS